MAEDVWEAGAVVDADGEIDLGEPAYELGVPANLAFSIDNVLRNGVMLLIEQPGLILLAGLNVWIVQMIPAILGMVLDLGSLAVQIGSGARSDPLLEYLPGLVRAITQLALFPVQQVVLAGAIVAVATHLLTGASLYKVLYTSFAPAMRALVYALVSGAISVTLGIVALGVAVGFGTLVYMTTDSLVAGGVVAVLVGFVSLAPLVYVGLGLQLGGYAAVLDDQWPLEALATSWRAAEGARLMLFLTNFVIALATLIGYCLFWIPAIVVQGVAIAGMTSGWVLYARPQPETSRLAFFERNPSRVR